MDEFKVLIIHYFYYEALSSPKSSTFKSNLMLEFCSERTSLVSYDYHDIGEKLH